MERAQATNATQEEVIEATASFRAAMKAKQPQLAMSLLDGPVDVHYLDLDGTSLLMAAAYRGYIDLCKRLIERGADAAYGFEEPAGEDEYGVANIGPWITIVSRAKAGGDPETINFAQCAFVIAHWMRLKKIRASDPKWFAYAAPELFKDAVRLELSEICEEMAPFLNEN